MPPLTPVESLLKDSATDVYGHRGFISQDYEFLPREPLPRCLPAQWRVWDEFLAEIPSWYRAGQVCRNLMSLPALDPTGLPDKYLVRANMVLGVLALGFKYCWQEMDEGSQRLHAGTLVPTVGDSVLAPVQAQVMQPWQAVWRRMGRHRSCVESDLFVANFVWGGDERYTPERVRGDSCRLLAPFFLSRTEHQFWFSVIEICSRFPGVSAPLAIQRAMQAEDHAGVAGQLVRLARIWQTLVEEVLASADTRVSAVEWGNTTARWTAAMSEGEEGFSGLFAPAWHVMDQLIGRTKYTSFLGQIMTRTRAMLPPAWRELIAAVGDMPVSEYVATHRGRCPELDEAYHFLCESYGYFFQLHHRKVFAYSYQAILSGRERSNGGIEGNASTPGWELANRHLRVSAAERLSGSRRAHAHVLPVQTGGCTSRLWRLPVRDLGWLPGDRAAIGIEHRDGTRATLLANFVRRDPGGNETIFWAPVVDDIASIRFVEREPGAFCRPPKQPSPVVIFSDVDCLGMGIALGQHQNARAAAVWLEGANVPAELRALVDGDMTLVSHPNLVGLVQQRAGELFQLLDGPAHLYVLGDAVFVRRIHTALRTAIAMHSALVDDAFRRLREQRRLHFCVQPATGARPAVAARLYPWDVATATDPRCRVRVICRNNVLDITGFLAIHIGGDTILSMLAGTDITKEFEIAHGSAAKTLGMPDVFVEGAVAPMPESLQPLTAFLYKVVRYTNAFVVTQTEVLRNNETDSYVQACGLLSALQLWPEATMWGQELAQCLGIDTPQQHVLENLCSSHHKNMIAFVKDCLSEPTGVANWADRLSTCVATYEDYGRMLTLHLCDILREAYFEGAVAVGKTAPDHIDDLTRYAQIRFGALRQSRPEYDRC